MIRQDKTGPGETKQTRRDEKRKRKIRDVPLDEIEMHMKLLTLDFDIYYKNTADYGFLVINNNCTKSNDDVNELYGNLKVPENLIKKM